MATRYFVDGGSGDHGWNSTAMGTTNWATSSGGAGGASIPTFSDNVIFDINSTSCNIASAAECLSLTCDIAYTGTLTLLGLFSCDGNFILTGFMNFNPNGKTAAIGSVTNATLTSGGHSFYDLIIGSNMYLSDDLSIIHSLEVDTSLFQNGKVITMNNGSTLITQSGVINAIQHQNGKLILDGVVTLKNYLLDVYNLQLNAGSTATFYTSSGSIFPKICVLGLFKSVGTNGSHVTINVSDATHASRARLQLMGTILIDYTDVSNLKTNGVRPISAHGTFTSSPYWRNASPQTVHVTNSTQLLAMDSSNNNVLDNDIDMTGVTWVPVGTFADPMTGSFDGQGHTIKNLNYDDGLAGNYAALFGVVGSSAQNSDGTIGNSFMRGRITNLNMTNVTLKGKINVGAIVGSLDSAEISYCNITGMTVSNPSSVTGSFGGIAGDCSGWPNRSSVTYCSVTNFSTNFTHNFSAVGGMLGQIFIWTSLNDFFIEHCYVYNANISCLDWSEVGGMVGYCEAFIQNCYVHTGTVLGNTLVGGLVGDGAIVQIFNSYADITVQGDNDFDSQIGGFIGYLETFDTPVSLENCYSVGIVTGTDKVGGFIGELSNSPFTISNCAWYSGAAAKAIGYSDDDGVAIATLSEKGYGTDEPVNTAFYSKTHTVYAQGT